VKTSGAGISFIAFIVFLSLSWRPSADGGTGGAGRQAAASLRNRAFEFDHRTGLRFGVDQRALDFPVPNMVAS